MITKTGDKRQSDPQGRGIIANKLLKAGSRYLDPAAQYHAKVDPPAHLNKSYYIKVEGTYGGYFEIAKEGDGAYKSHTYFLNEARETNVLVDSRKPNIRYAHRTHRSGASDTRRFEWEVVRDIPEDAELVVEYGGAVGGKGGGRGAGGGGEVEEPQYCP